MLRKMLVEQFDLYLVASGGEWKVYSECYYESEKPVNVNINEINFKSVTP